MSDTTYPKLINDCDSVALVDGEKSLAYREINASVNRFATGLLAGTNDLDEERIAFIIPASFDYVTALHGIWRAGGIAIPLNAASAEAELEHYLASANVTRVIANQEHQRSVRAVCV